ncbi:Integral membrane protein OS=Streptomyces tendae OX=1932 GN=F3L20_26385 PE=4 SV=1 [Streptomyces tendae]
MGRALAAFFRWTLVKPARWVYRTVLTPVGHAVRDAVLRPVAEAARSVGRVTRDALRSVRVTARQVRRDVRRALGMPAGPAGIGTREKRPAGR